MANGKEITVEVQLDGNEVNRLRALLDDYASLQRRWDDPRNDVYDLPNAELPKRDGATMAQRIWNAFALGEEPGRIRSKGDDAMAL